jgi:hypothetical protein
LRTDELARAAAAVTVVVGQFHGVLDRRLPRAWLPLEIGARHPMYSPLAVRAPLAIPSFGRLRCRTTPRMRRRTARVASNRCVA